MMGDAYRSLLRDLQRYVQEEIAGRSYLIAGHRGSGKTSLTLQAIEDLRRTFLIQASSASTSAGRRDRPQRPLLVKLHGPSLLEAPPPTPPPAAPIAETDPADPATGAPPPTPPAPVADGPHAALVQITVGLYRALAAEAAFGYAAHAREVSHPASREAAQESAAQLTFDLDGGPGAADLRLAWSRLGRLPLGVFWPSRADPLLKAAEVDDEAWREIVALSAAAQAYQVCIGAVTYQLKDKTTDKNNLQVIGRGAWSLRDAVGQVGALGVGALSGAALWTSGPPTAVAVGALVWLLGSSTVNWTRTRTQDRDRSADYTFLRDRSIQTLDRELPTAIQRVREAGLAPVFVIDELDKLDAPETKIAELIKRLKHIVADYGFFCFLTDRNYFDYVERAVHDTAFPREHTYFSERWLVAYRPQEIFDYVFGLLTPDAGDPDAAASADTSEANARSTIAYWVLHRAKLNFADIGRELNRLVNADGWLTIQPEDVLGRADVRLAAGVQMAIDAVLQRPEIKTRLSSDTAFAQKAYDALYTVSRCWEADEKDFDLAPAKLRERLEKRLNACARSEAPDAPAADDPPAQKAQVDDADLELLASATTRLVELLTDFKAFAAEVQAATGASSRLADIIPADLGGLLRPISRGARKYSFVYDAFGRNRDDDGTASDDEIADLLRLVDELEKLLAHYAIAFEDLTRSGLLPASLDWNAVQRAKARLDPSKPRIDDTRRSAATAALRALRVSLDEYGRRLSAGLALCEQLVLTAKGRATYVSSLAALGRHPVLGPAAGSNATVKTSGYPPLTTMVALSGLPETVADFADDQLRGLKPAARLTRLGAVRQIELWLPRVRRWAVGEPPADKPLTFVELVDAASGEGPSALLRSDLTRMSLLEWSEFCLWALRGGPTTSPPRWALIAALRALEFPKSLLEKLVSVPGPDGQSPSAEAQRDARQLLSRAQAGKPGTLVIRLNSGLDGPQRNLSEDAALLYVSRSAFYQHEVGLSWLRDHDAFTTILDEVEYERQQDSAPAA